MVIFENLYSVSNHKKYWHVAFSGHINKLNGPYQSRYNSGGPVTDLGVGGGNAKQRISYLEQHLIDTSPNAIADLMA